MTLRRKGPVCVLFAALLLVAGFRAAGGQEPRSPATDSSDTPHESPRAEPSPEPAAPPPSNPEPQAEPSPPSDPPSDSGSAPEPPQDDSSDGRTAVPTGPGNPGHGPSRQPPTQHGHGGHGHSGGAVYPEDGAIWTDPDVYGGPGAPLGYPSHAGRGARDDMGALDLDISPGRAQVFLDGQRLGTVDDFDGWPKYLWLPEGTYDLVFYLDGFRTLARRMTVERGLVIDMDDRLQPGPSIRPEELSLPPGNTD